MTSATACRISIGVLVCMIAASLLAVPALPPDAAIALHFDSRGEGDSYASPLAAFAVMPAAVLLAIAVFIITPRFDRRGANLAGSDRAYGVFWLWPSSCCWPWPMGSSSPGRWGGVCRLSG